MWNKKLYIFSLSILLIINAALISETFVSFDVTTLDNPAPGYIFTGPVNDGYASLYDNSGKAVYFKDLSMYGKDFTALRIIDNGYFACYSYSTYQWFIMNEYFHIIDIVSAKNSLTNFHTLFLSPQGNYLLVGDNNIEVNMSLKVANGKTNARVANHRIQELDQARNVVFDWNVYEHIDIRMTTEDNDLTALDIDPYHINCARYDSDGNILANFRNLDAIIKINRNTGDIMWWWGGSKSRRNDFQFMNDNENGFTGFSHQHDPKRLPNGNILIFDNGNLKPVAISRAVEYTLDEINKTATKVWEYRRSPGIFAEFMGNAQRLPNGNTIIGWGVNTKNNHDVICTEVTAEGNKVFEMKLAGYPGYYQVQRNVFKMDAVTLTVNTQRSYNFNEGYEQTGVKLDITAINGNAKVSVEKHYYPAQNISFTSQAGCSILPLRWVINSRGINSFSGKIYFDLSNLGNINNKSDLKLFRRNKEGTGSFTKLETTYNQALNRLEANIQEFGEFIVAYTYLIMPIQYEPVNEANNVQVNPILKWTRNSDSEKGRVQLSRSATFNTMELDTIVSGLPELKLKNLMNYSRYYWRVKLLDGSCSSNWQQASTFVTVISEPKLVWPANKSKDRDLSGELIWSKVDGGTQYKLQISDTITFARVFIDEIIDSSDKFIYSSLHPLTKYYWRVAAGNNGIFGGWSSVYEFTTSAGKPVQSAPLKDSSGVKVSGILKWESLIAVNLYRIQLAGSRDFKVLILDTIVRGTYINYNGLNHSSFYYWRVLGLLKDTVTNWSDIWQFRTQTATPVLKYPLDGASGVSHYYNLYWSNVDSAVEYQVQIAKDADFKNIIYDREVKTTYYQYWLKFSSLYYWRVRATDGYSHSEWSDTRSFVTNSQLFYPRDKDSKIPVNVRFDWYPTFFAESYELRLAADSLYKNELEIHSNLVQSSHFVKGLAYNRRYYWSIREYRDSLAGEWTETFSFLTALRKAVIIEPSIKYIMANTIRIQWEAIDEAEYYTIQIALDEDFKNNIIYKDNLITTFFDFERMPYDTLYYCRVMGFNSINASGWSDIITFRKVVPYQLISPNGNELWPKDGRAKLIKWDSTLMSEVRIELLNNGMDYYIISDSSVIYDGEFEWIIPDFIAEGSLYQIRIINLGERNKAAISKGFFTISGTTGVENLYSELSQGFKFWSDPSPLANPNPFDSETLIELPFISDNFVVRIFDATGIEIKSFYGKSDFYSSNSSLVRKYIIRWDGTNSKNEKVANGIYFIRINYADKILQTIKVLLNR